MDVKFKLSYPNSNYSSAVMIYFTTPKNCRTNPKKSVIYKEFKFIWTNCLVIHQNFPNHHYRYYFISIEDKNCVTALDIYEGISGLHLPLLEKTVLHAIHKKSQFHLACFHQIQLSKNKNLFYCHFA